MSSRSRYNDYDDNTQYSGNRNQDWDRDYDEGRYANTSRTQGRGSRSSSSGYGSDYDEDIPRRSTEGRQFTQSHTNWDNDEYDDLGGQGRYANVDRDEEENYSPSRRGSQRSTSSSSSRRGPSNQSNQSGSRRNMSSRDRWDEDYDSEMDEGHLHAREDYEDEDFDEERYSRNRPSQY